MPAATALFKDSMDLIRCEIEVGMRSLFSSESQARSEADRASMAWRRKSCCAISQCFINWPDILHRMPYSAHHESIANHCQLDDGDKPNQ